MRRAGSPCAVAVPAGNGSVPPSHQGHGRLREEPGGPGGIRQRARERPATASPLLQPKLGGTSASEGEVRGIRRYLERLLCKVPGVAGRKARLLRIGRQPSILAGRPGTGDGGRHSERLALRYADRGRGPGLRAGVVRHPHAVSCLRTPRYSGWRIADQNIYGKEPVTLPGFASFRADTNYRSPERIATFMREVLPFRFEIGNDLPGLGTGVHGYDDPGRAATHRRPSGSAT